MNQGDTTRMTDRSTTRTFHVVAVEALDVTNGNIARPHSVAVEFKDPGTNFQMRGHFIIEHSDRVPRIGDTIEVTVHLGTAEWDGRYRSRPTFRFETPARPARPDEAGRASHD